MNNSDSVTERAYQQREQSEYPPERGKASTETLQRGIRQKGDAKR